MSSFSVLPPGPTAPKVALLQSWSTAIESKTLARDARRAEIVVPGSSLLDCFVGRLESRFLRSFNHGAHLGGLLDGSKPIHTETSSKLHGLIATLHLGLRSLLGVIWGLAVTTTASPWLLLSASLRGPSLLEAPNLPGSYPSLAVLMLKDLGCATARQRLDRKWHLTSPQVITAADTPLKSWRAPSPHAPVDLSQAIRLAEAEPLPVAWAELMDRVCENAMAAAIKHLRFGANNQIWHVDAEAFDRQVSACWSVVRPVEHQDLVRVECHALFDGTTPLITADLGRQATCWPYPHPIHIALTLDMDLPNIGGPGGSKPWSLAPGGEPVVDSAAYDLRRQLEARIQRNA